MYIICTNLILLKYHNLLREQINAFVLFHHKEL